MNYIEAIHKSGITTPFYFYDMDVFTKTLDKVAGLSAANNIAVHYAIKANNEPKLLKMIAAKGFGADCVSGNEVLLAAECGFAPEKIMFAGVGKTDKEITDALTVGIGAFNVESLPELENINLIASQMGKIAPIQLRINPNIDAHTHKYITTGLDENKFGFSREFFDQAVQAIKASKNIKFLGLQFHIGSQITDVENVFTLEAKVVSEIVETFEKKGLVVENIDLGGGLGVDYQNPDLHPIADFDSWMEIISKNLVHRPEQHVHIEPGRAIVCQCGSLISKVLYVKEGIKKNFVILDAGMNDLIRPALYSAYHRIENITSVGAPTQTYDVVGPVCESSDVWGEARELTQTKRGDLVAIRSAGAYGSVMASRYNCKPLAPAVFSDEI